MNTDVRQRSREIVGTLDEVRAGAIRVLGQANRSLAILTSDLEPTLYDHEDFLDAVKKFVLARSFARIRVLIMDPTHAIKNGNRLVTIGRRLNSYIEFRNVHEDYRDRGDAFVIADDTALVYRADATRWQGLVALRDPGLARRYLGEFDDIWEASAVEPSLRQLRI